MSVEIIEVQNGEYVGEDDVVRVDDKYGREEELIESPNIVCYSL